jgi:hypothetical protein
MLLGWELLTLYPHDSILRTIGTVERLPVRTTPRRPYGCINMYIKINGNYCSLAITLFHLHSKFHTDIMCEIIY